MTTSWIGSFALLVTLAPAAHAVDRLVPQAYPTVQAAIDAAGSGDAVLVSPGTYSGPIDLKGKAIRVAGVGLASQVVVQGGESVVRCTSGETSACVIENLTITGGSASTGGGVRVINSSPKIKSCRIILNTAAGASECQGGGVYVLGGSPVIEDTSISANTCSPAGVGVGCGGGWDARYIGKGGGIYLQDTSAVVRRCTISGNVVSSVIPPYSANPVADAQAGGLWRSGSGSVTVVDCSITSNNIVASCRGSNQSCCSGTGGGVVISGLTLISGSKISGNSNSPCGDSAGGARFTGTGIFMVNTQICGNSPSNLAGGYVDEGGNVIKTDCPPTCTADIDGSGEVDGADVSLLLLDWGPCQ